MTNEIPDDTVNGQPMNIVNKQPDGALPQCLLCEKVVNEVFKKLNKQKSRVLWLIYENTKMK